MNSVQQSNIRFMQPFTLKLTWWTRDDTNTSNPGVWIQVSQFREIYNEMELIYAQQYLKIQQSYHAHELPGNLPR